MARSWNARPSQIHSAPQFPLSLRVRCVCVCHRGLNWQEPETGLLFQTNSPHVFQVRLTLKWSSLWDKVMQGLHLSFKKKKKVMGINIINKVNWCIVGIVLPPSVRLEWKVYASPHTIVRVALDVALFGEECHFPQCNYTHRSKKGDVMCDT